MRACSTPSLAHLPATLRIVGEMRLGWRRTSDPADLMYAPIMSIDDVDRMSLTRTLQSHKQTP